MTLMASPLIALTFFLIRSGVMVGISYLHRHFHHLKQLGGPEAKVKLKEQQDFVKNLLSTDKARLKQSQ